MQTEQELTTEEKSRLAKFRAMQKANRSVDAAHKLTCNINQQIEELYKKLHDANEQLRLAQVERNRCYREYNEIPVPMNGGDQ